MRGRTAGTAAAGRRAGRVRAVTTVASAAALTLLCTTGAHAEGRGDVRVTKTVVNSGNNVIIGTSARLPQRIGTCWIPICRRRATLA